MSKMTQSEASNASLWIQRIFNKITNLPILSIAIIDGIAFGGGLELALACDIRISSEKSQFALPEMRYGIIPAGGGTIQFQKHVGYSNTIHSLISNKIIQAQEAFNMGLIQEIVPEQHLEEFIKGLSVKIMEYSRQSITEVKAHLKIVSDMPLKDAYKHEAELFGKQMERDGSRKIRQFFEMSSNRKQNNG
jgi:enoyl-CoA hydratase